MIWGKQFRIKDNIDFCIFNIHVSRKMLELWDIESFFSSRNCIDIEAKTSRKFYFSMQNKILKNFFLIFCIFLDASMQFLDENKFSMPHGSSIFRDTYIIFNKKKNMNKNCRFSLFFLKTWINQHYLLLIKFEVIKFKNFSLMISFCEIMDVKDIDWVI